MSVSLAISAIIRELIAEFASVQARQREREEANLATLQVRPPATKVQSRINASMHWYCAAAVDFRSLRFHLARLLIGACKHEMCTATAPWEPGRHIQ